ncbi:MAG: hypothetical protein QX191_00435 [Methylococcaceae bacterium]
MKLWLDPDLSDSEYKFILFSWFDALPEHQKTKALIKELLLAGIKVDGLANNC